ncbi:MAG: AAA family ATPase [Candidatus Woesearchaeota archaeon]
MTPHQPLLGKNLRDAEFQDIIGQGHVKDELKSAILMDRHLILIGPPGIGKTTLVKNLSKLLPSMEVVDCGFHCKPGHPLCPDCIARARKGEEAPTKKVKGEERFIRVQGSPDLTAEDLLGDIDPLKAMKYGPLSLEAFTPGKIFKANNGILFFDEVNRCSEKLQNALLQVLEEGKLTIGSYDVDFDANFIFIGTMNPDDNSTEPLSDVFLDRFDIARMRYPESQQVEERIVDTKGHRLVTVPQPVKEALVRYVRELREDDKLEKHPSVRATLGLYERAQANAYLAGREEVSFEDLGKAVESVIAHRIRLKPSAQFLSTPEAYVRASYDKLMERVDKETGGGR